MKIDDNFREMSASRRSGRSLRPGLSDDSSGPNSPSIDSFDDLSLDGMEKRKGKGNKTDKALKQLNAKEDANSMFLAGFDPSKGRKAKLKLSDKAYKDSNPGIVGGAGTNTTKNRNAKKDSLYDGKGTLIMVNADTFKTFVNELYFRVV